ncbi:hypothetical protein EDD73_10624 [Heliophilum fasciatum]|uniref:Uncharacterized protein n=1 Tax=Heliophilum fasciatum TaxID=35700 RepID=A0A4V2SX70_9FIRM|nr:hypothetical protein [Heliophilum fasciatum]TCP65146.1 hypothetical protein EDD73_10624 [Heliophilum fasciatum]
MEIVTGPCHVCAHRAKCYRAETEVCVFEKDVHADIHDEE